MPFIYTGRFDRLLPYKQNAPYDRIMARPSVGNMHSGVIDL